jgi:hypothetical protein
MYHFTNFLNFKSSVLVKRALFLLNAAYITVYMNACCYWPLILKITARKCKRKFVSVHTTKAQWGSRGTYPLIFGHNSRRTRAVHFSTHRFTPVDKILCTDWTGSWVGRRGGLDVFEKKKILSPARIRTPDRPARIPDYWSQ